jgi:SOS-response transcriptional repressor LexA
MKSVSEIRKSNLEKISSHYESQRELADVLEITPGYLNQLLTGYRNIGEKVARKFEKKLRLEEFFLDLADEDVMSKESNIALGPDTRGLVPLISWVQAGAWCEAIDNYAPGDGESWWPCPTPHGKNTYALRVTGDSMTSPYSGHRSYPEGTIIYVDPDVPVATGRRVVAKLPNSNEVTFKEYRYDGGKHYLKPLNPQYQTIEINEETHFCGVVIGQFVPE